MIQQTINTINQTVQAMLDSGGLDKRVIAVAVEANQRYVEYLDELEVTATVEPCNIVVKVNGETIRFNSIEEIASWITSIASS